MGFSEPMVKSNISLSKLTLATPPTFRTSHLGSKIADQGYVVVSELQSDRTLGGWREYVNGGYRW